MIFDPFKAWRGLISVVCIVLIAPGGIPVYAQQPADQSKAPKEDAPKLKSADQLDSLVAPIALYPDPLLAQVLASSTYPLEIVQLNRWMKANPKLTGEDLTKAAAKQPWDASVQALVAFPQAIKLLDENIQWTTDLGNAFLEQQGDVMDAVQRMRKKAKDSGKLDSSKEQKVEVKVVESKTIIEIQPSNPQVVYVPSYNPTVVYGAPPVYAYPPIAYPYGAVAATAAISFGVGVAMGAFWGGCCGGGGWGWGAGWGGNNITINNNFQNRYGYNNIQGGNRTNIGSGNVGSGNRGGNSWQHNPSHRGAVPYSSNNTAQRFGGAGRDGSGSMQRADRSGQGAGSRGDGGLNRAAQQPGTRDLSNTRDRAQSGAGGGQDRVGNRSLDSGGSRQNSAFGGADSRSRAQASSDRGFSSSRQSSGASRSSGGSSSRSFGGGGGGGSRSRSGGGGRRR